MAVGMPLTLVRAFMVILRYKWRDYFQERQDERGEHKVCKLSDCCVCLIYDHKYEIIIVVIIIIINTP